MRIMLNIFAGFIIFLLPLESFALAQTPYITEPMTSKIWESLPADQRLKACTSVECSTLNKLMESFQQIDERDFPNSMAHDDNNSEKSKFSLPIINFVDTSIIAKQEACRLLVSLAENVKDLSVTLHALEIATLLEEHNTGCLQKVVAATPKEIDGTDVLSDALSLCEARHEPYCKKLSK
jgi:hypothetical protein